MRSPSVAQADPKKTRALGSVRISIFQRKRTDERTFPASSPSSQATAPEKRSFEPAGGFHLREEATAAGSATAACRAYRSK